MMVGFLNHHIMRRMVSFDIALLNESDCRSWVYVLCNWSAVLLEPASEPNRRHAWSHKYPLHNKMVSLETSGLF